MLVSTALASGTGGQHGRPSFGRHGTITSRPKATEIIFVFTTANEHKNHYKKRQKSDNRQNYYITPHRLSPIFSVPTRMIK
jgi:hypothetical protein